MTIDVRHAEPRDSSSIGRFVLRHEAGQIYWSPMFLDFIRATTGATTACLVAESAGEVVGVLPYAYRDSSEGVVVNSLPWYGSHGATLVEASDAGDRARTALLDAYREATFALEPLTAVTILGMHELAHEAQIHDALGTIARDRRIGTVTPLASDDGRPLDDEQLMASFHSKTRNLVRKSMNQDLVEEVDTDEAWAIVETMHADVQAAQGRRAKQVKDFAALRALPPDVTRVSVARLGGVPIGALLVATHGCWTEYLVPVSALEHRARQPMTFLIWRAMQAVRDAGALHWSWGGSGETQDSLLHFKTRFGGRATPYTYSIHAEEPDRAAAAAPAVLAEIGDWYIFPVEAR